MLVYLPIAELPVDMFIIFLMGGGVGFLSGMFGIGGGFLLTPLLIFFGIPPAVSVATVTSQVVASSASGVVTYWRRRTIDFKLAGYLLCAGIAGSAAGVVVFDMLRGAGQLDIIISISYVSFLGAIGGLMLIESVRAITRRRRDGTPEQMRRPGRHNWIHGLPIKVRFRRSRIFVSVIPILAIGMGVGFLGTMLGIGGGFIMVPALIYLFHVPTNIVVGTSLLQILVTMSAATILHAGTTQSVDVILALILIVGGVIGAQLGARMGQKLRGDVLRLLLAVIVLGTGLRFAFDLVVTPDDLFSLTMQIGYLE